MQVLVLFTAPYFISGHLLLITLFANFLGFFLFFIMSPVQCACSTCFLDFKISFPFPKGRLVHHGEHIFLRFVGCGTGEMILTQTPRYYREFCKLEVDYDKWLSQDHGRRNFRKLPLGFGLTGLLGKCTLRPESNVPQMWFSQLLSAHINFYYC